IDRMQARHTHLHLFRNADGETIFQWHVKFLYIKAQQYGLVHRLVFLMI
ncbi:MAG: hypothetical protein RL282_1482, partial [Bacteroidota bacterium]